MGTHVQLHLLIIILIVIVAVMHSPPTALSIVRCFDPYATSVDAVADSYFQLGGRAFLTL